MWGIVPRGSRCPASPRRALLAENLGKLSLWVIINAPWYKSRAFEEIAHSQAGDSGVRARVLQDRGRGCSQASVRVGKSPGGCRRVSNSRNAPMKDKSRRKRIASMSQAEREQLIPLARKVRADARRDDGQRFFGGRVLAHLCGCRAWAWREFTQAAWCRTQASRTARRRHRP
jgi:hypothetical protein